MDTALIVNDYRKFRRDGTPRPKPYVPSKNVVPPITDPLGSGWAQPSTSRIEIDDTHALMSLRTFKELHEYSASYPTGVYEGKMWRRHDGAHDRVFLARGGKPTWYLAWYGHCDDPTKVSNNYRKILLTDAEITEQR